MDDRNSSDIGAELGKYVMAKRLDMGLSPTKFSAKAGIARSSLHNMEAGRPVSMTNMNLIIKAMDKTWADIAPIIDGVNNARQ